LHVQFFCAIARVTLCAVAFPGTSKQVAEPMPLMDPKGEPAQPNGKKKSTSHCAETAVMTESKRRLSFIMPMRYAG